MSRKAWLEGSSYSSRGGTRSGILQLRANRTFQDLKHPVKKGGESSFSILYIYVRRIPDREGSSHNYVFVLSDEIGFMQI
jgi:hypothetical protein